MCVFKGQNTLKCVVFQNTNLQQMRRHRLRRNYGNRWKYERARWIWSENVFDVWIEWGSKLLAIKWRNHVESNCSIHTCCMKRKYSFSLSIPTINEVKFELQTKTKKNERKKKQTKTNFTIFSKNKTCATNTSSSNIKKSTLARLRSALNCQKEIISN